IFIAVFGAMALIFSIISSEHLVLLARTSFAGTAMMGPMILLGMLSSKKPSILMPVATIFALLTYILSIAGVLTASIWVLEMELFLFLCLVATAIIEVGIIHRLKQADLHE
ncbi:MAG TPA: hypothetical protein VKN36_13085, partial [Eudoraea sp.]|nr:hypothetical protein [Eudoraea sp.]